MSSACREVATSSCPRRLDSVSVATMVVVMACVVVCGVADVAQQVHADISVDAAMKVLIVGDAVSCGVTSKTRIPGLEHGAVSYRYQLQALLKTTEVHSRVVFVGPQRLRHQESSTDVSDDGVTLYAGGWSLTAQEVAATKVVDDWSKLFSPDVVVLQLGGNDLGAGYVDLLLLDARSSSDDGDSVDAERLFIEREESVATQTIAAISNAAKRAAQVLQRQAFRRCRLVLVPTLLPVDERHSHHHLVRRVNEGLAQSFEAATATSIQKACSSHDGVVRVLLVSWHEGFDPDSMLSLPQGILPNRNGEAYLAARLAAPLQVLAAQSNADFSFASTTVSVQSQPATLFMMFTDARQNTLFVGIVLATVISTLSLAYVICTDSTRSDRPAHLKNTRRVADRETAKALLSHRRTASATHPVQPRSENASEDTTEK